jgi:hypothetical protein
MRKLLWRIGSVSAYKWNLLYFFAQSFQYLTYRIHRIQCTSYIQVGTAVSLSVSLSLSLSLCVSLSLSLSPQVSISLYLSLCLSVSNIPDWQRVSLWYLHVQNTQNTAECTSYLYILYTVICCITGTVSLSVSLSLCLSRSLSLSLSVSLSLSIYLSLSPQVSISLYLSVCLSLSARNIPGFLISVRHLKYWMDTRTSDTLWMELR